MLVTHVHLVSQRHLGHLLDEPDVVDVPFGMQYLHAVKDYHFYLKGVRERICPGAQAHPFDGGMLIHSIRDCRQTTR